jgi:hypothetical protein
VCQCVCRFSNDIDATLVLIADMNAALPLYDQAVALHPSKRSLQFPLKNLFNEYIDCCINIMKEFSQSPISECLFALPTVPLVAVRRGPTQCLSGVGRYGGLSLRCFDGALNGQHSSNLACLHFVPQQKTCSECHTRPNSESPSRKQ